MIQGVSIWPARWVPVFGRGCLPAAPTAAHSEGPSRPNGRQAALRLLCLVGLAGASSLGAQVNDAQLQAILEQNRKLQAQVQQQQQTISALHERVNALVQASERHERALQDLREAPAATPDNGNRTLEVRLSGEAGLAFFRTGRAGSYPNSEFRVDDAKLFVEAPLIKDVYFFGGLDLSLREANDEYFHVGEFYVDFENVSQLWGGHRQLNVRAGRLNIPFGTEYYRRGVIDNPLISHSLADIWGVDEGIEAYGSLGPVSYVIAVQNGGRKTMRDYDSDKSVTARVSFHPAPWLDIHLSGLRTGDINIAGDSLTEVWIGNGFFRSIGSSATTRTFQASLWEAEASSTWKGGHAIVAVGGADYDDDDRGADNARHLRYVTLEGVQALAGDLYGAVRYSAIDAPKGYPLVGHGDFGNFFYRSPLTEDLWRLSLGLGYRLGPPVILKMEYAFEGGRLVNGARRDQEDLLSTELAVKF